MVVSLDNFPQSCADVPWKKFQVADIVLAAFKTVLSNFASLVFFQALGAEGIEDLR